MSFEEVDAYIKKLPRSDAYKSLETPQQQEEVFGATEMLKDEFEESKLNARVIALQTLFNLEGEDEEFSKYKRQGVKSFSAKGVSVSFEGNEIAPAVLNIMGRSRASVGRLI